MILTPANLPQHLERALLGELDAPKTQLLGVEVEHLILHRQTRENAPLRFCRDLLESLASQFGGKRFFDGEVLNRVDLPDCTLTMEPGGQLEVSTEPRPSLMEIDPIVQRVTDRVRETLAATDYGLVSLGHAPVTPIEQIELLPRDRYRIMDEAMPQRGPLVRHMMRATAGVQISYDFFDREDAGRKLALLFRLTPLMLAVTANSREVGGRDSGNASFRHRVWWFTDSDRTGVPEGCLHASTALAAYQRFALRATTLFLRRDGRLVPAPAQSFGDLVAMGGITNDDLSLHLSSLFPLVRLRNYLEVRCLDAVEWRLARGVLALLSGIVYCPAATARAEQLSDELVLDPPDQLREFHLDVAKFGLDARSPRGTPFRSMLADLLQCSRATLGGSSCDWALPSYLDVLDAVLASGSGV